MTKHKWHKEIKAWADGAEIEAKLGDEWLISLKPTWSETSEYRIKPQPKPQPKESRIVREMKEAIEDLRKSLGKEPQPKEPQYLYAVDMVNGLGIYFGLSPSLQHDKRYVGKIKLEADDD